MATSETMIDDVVRISGLSRPTVRSYVEKLRENGLIQKSGRGARVALMKVDDAAALLAATLAHPTIAKAADAALAVLKLPLSKAYVHHPRELTSVALNIEKFSPDNDESHIRTFGELTRWLLYRATSFCTKEEDHLEGWETLFGEAGNNHKIEIYFCQTAKRHPAYFAFIKLNFSVNDHLCLEYGGPDPREPGEPKAPNSPWTILYDESGYQHLTVKFIGMPTLLAFARSVVKEPPPS